jgi:transposase InsO family protein
MAGEGLPVEVACRVLGVSCAGYYAWRFRPPSTRAVRHAWLTDLIREIHTASYGAYGANRVHAELVLGRGVRVGHCSVAMLMQRAGIKGRTGSPKRRGMPGVATAEDLVDRVFHRNAPNQLWVTDVTEHPTREGKVYCAVVLDAFSRRVVGWSISHNPTAGLTTNALGMAIEQRDAAHGETIIHSDHGTPFTAWAFTDRARRSGLVPSMGSVGDCYDNAMIEAFWSRMQVELLDTRRWRTRVELANAIFEYIEIFHNRRRRHSSLGMLTPIEFELKNINTQTQAA